MAELDSAIHDCLSRRQLAARKPCAYRNGMKQAWVYIVTNRPNGTLYIGVTSNLPRRAWEHREGAVAGFSARYNLKHLVLAERHADMRTAIAREKAMKHWSRARKIRTILATNPDWRDLYDDLIRGL